MLCPVRRLWLFIKFWLPPLLWMSLIFIGSADSGSVGRSSRIVEPLMHWLFPHMSQEGMWTCVLIARKCAHLTEYGLCAILLWRAKRQFTSKDTRPWDWGEARWAIVMIFLYACTDEIHQCFVPGRGAAFHDVVLDTIGGALGIFVLWRVGKISKKW